MKLPILILPIILLLHPSCFPGNNNLLTNPGFENKSSGWEDLWVREKGKGKAQIFSYTGKPGGMVLRVSYSGSRDWSFGQRERIEVLPGEVYAFSAWVKCENVRGGAQLSVVLRDREDKVIDWSCGLKETAGTHGWKRLDGRFIIPRGCVMMRFRITGWGHGQSFWDDLFLARIKKAPDTQRPEGGKISIMHENTGVTFSYDTNRVQITAGSHSQTYTSQTYTIEGFGDSVFFKDIIKDDNKLTLIIQNTYSGDIKAVITIPVRNEVTFTLSGKGVMETDFAFPGRLMAGKYVNWIVPQNEGLCIPTNDPYYMPHRLQLYQGHGGLSMPFIGLTGPDNGILVISETPDDNYIQYHPPEESMENRSGWTFMWQPSMGNWEYDRRLRFFLIEEGGYVALAKTYRKYVKERGMLISLKQKQESVPSVGLLIGAADIWWWGKAEWWTHDLECGNVAKELKQAGLTRVLWSNQASPKAIDDMNTLQFLTSRYDIYQDVWDPGIQIEWLNKKGWPEDLVLNSDGSWRRGWVHKEGKKEYPGGIICSQKGFERMKKEVAEELKTHAYRARFIDTTTASPLHDCYHPGHPLTRSGDREYKSKLLGYLSGHLRLVTGSETGIDWAVPYVHYFEGMMSIGPYRLKDSGYDLISYKKPDADFLRFQTGHFYRIPLFELVYHDCVVSFWYWGDSSNRLHDLWHTRDLFNLLYGTGPLYIMDPERWKKDKKRFIESYTTATMISHNTGYSEMLTHRFLTGDHTVQYTKFANGSEVWVNFGRTPYTTENGRTIEPEGYSVTTAIPGE